MSDADGEVSAFSWSGVEFARQRRVPISRDDSRRGVYVRRHRVLVDRCRPRPLFGRCRAVYLICTSTRALVRFVRLWRFLVSCNLRRINGKGWTESHPLRQISHFNNLLTS